MGTLNDDEEVANNMTCYKGGETVIRSHQMCDVTSTLKSSECSYWSLVHPTHGIIFC